jgi:hypothetical protein
MCQHQHSTVFGTHNAEAALHGGQMNNAYFCFRYGGGVRGGHYSEDEQLVMQISALQMLADKVLIYKIYRSLRIFTTLNPKLSKLIHTAQISLPTDILPHINFNKRPRLSSSSNFPHCTRSRAIIRNSQRRTVSSLDHPQSRKRLVSASATWCRSLVLRRVALYNSVFDVQIDESLLQERLEIGETFCVCRVIT